MKTIPLPLRFTRTALTLGVWGLLMLGGLPAPSQAQEPSRERPLLRQEMLDRFQARYERTVRRELELNGEEWEEVRSALHEFQGRRLELLGERETLRREIRNSRSQSRNPESAEVLLARVRDLRQRESRLEQEEEERLLGLIGPDQFLRLRAIRTDLADRIRRVDPPPRRERGRGNPGPGPS